MSQSFIDLKISGGSKSAAELNDLVQDKWAKVQAADNGALLIRMESTYYERAICDLATQHGFRIIERRTARSYRQPKKVNLPNLPFAIMLDPSTLNPVTCEIAPSPLGSLPPALRTLEDARAQGFQLQQTYNPVVWLTERKNSKRILILWHTDRSDEPLWQPGIEFRLAESSGPIRLSSAEVALLQDCRPELMRLRGSAGETARKELAWLDSQLAQSVLVDRFSKNDLVKMVNNPTHYRWPSAEGLATAQSLRTRILTPAQPVELTHGPGPDMTKFVSEAWELTAQSGAVAVAPDLAKLLLKAAQIEIDQYLPLLAERHYLNLDNAVDEVIQLQAGMLTTHSEKYAVHCGICHSDELSCYDKEALADLNRRLLSPVIW